MRFEPSQAKWSQSEARESHEALVQLGQAYMMSELGSVQNYNIQASSGYN